MAETAKKTQANPGPQAITGSAPVPKTACDGHQERKDTALGHDLHIEAAPSQQGMYQIPEARGRSPGTVEGQQDAEAHQPKEGHQ